MTTYEVQALDSNRDEQHVVGGANQVTRAVAIALAALELPRWVSVQIVETSTGEVWQRFDAGAASK